MSGFEEKSYNVFEMFKKQWALVAAGNVGHWNACTVGWGSLGTVWTRPGKEGHAVTVYLHPARYTQQFLKENDTFTVSFFPESRRAALEYMGTHSGRNGDKAAAAGLTPIPAGESVSFREAELVFVCRKIYAHPFEKTAMAEDVQANYINKPTAFPADENGEWQPHWEFIGEIIDVIDKRE